MIRNDQELAVTRKRVAMFERMLEELRETARPEEWPALSSGYRVEIERMQREILDYLFHTPAQPEAHDRSVIFGTAAPRDSGSDPRPPPTRG